MFDIVVPCHPKDEPTLLLCLHQIMKHLTGWQTIHVLAPPPRFKSGQLPLQYRLPFDYASVNWVVEPGPQSERHFYELRQSPRSDRANWVHQTLLKLQAKRYIPDLLPDYLCVDADVLFMRPVPFFTGERWFQWHQSVLHPAYRDTFERLTGMVYPVNHGFVMDHMMFRQSRLDEMIAHVLRYTKSKSFQWAVLKTINVLEKSPFAECDTFAAWMRLQCPDEVEPRQLHIRNLPFIPSDLWVEVHEDTDIDLVACHEYMR